jgi:hypothetical protein
VQLARIDLAQVDEQVGLSLQSWLAACADRRAARDRIRRMQNASVASANVLSRVGRISGNAASVPRRFSVSEDRLQSAISICDGSKRISRREFAPGRQALHEEGDFANEATKSRALQRKRVKVLLLRDATPRSRAISGSGFRSRLPHHGGASDHTRAELREFPDQLLGQMA